MAASVQTSNVGSTKGTLWDGHRKTSPPSSPTAPAARTVYRRAYDGLQRSKTIMKDSPLTVLGLSHKNSTNTAQIVDQARVLCEDYIYYRIEKSRAGMGGGRENPVVEQPTVTDVSREIQLIGAKLEAKYPALYSNVSRQVGMPFKSDTNIRKALNAIGDVMFRYNVTWGRIVAMFAITGSVAVECVQNDRPEVIRYIVNIFADVMERNTAGWICEQGGWVEIMKAFRFNKETRSLWALTGLGVVLGFAFTWITTVQI